MIFLHLALRNIERHRVRSVLATIGIIIGVLAIASLGILGNSINLLVLNLISDVGDTILVTPHIAASMMGSFSGDSGTQAIAGISQKDVDEITRLAGQNPVIPVLQDADEITFSSDESGYATVIGLKAEDIPMLLAIRDGQYIKENSAACMVGRYLADEYDLKPGSRIRIGDESVRVAAIIGERGFAIDINPDYAVVVSKKWFDGHYGKEDEYNRVIIKVQDLADIDEVKEKIDHQFNRQDEMVDILDSRDLLNQIDEIYGQITLFLVGIGAVSLVIAGVSILNVMIISVTERIREIGIMRSLGAERMEVMRMFLYEAMALGMIGSIIGGIFSGVIGYLISAAAIEVFTAGTTFGEGATIFNAAAVAYILFAMGFGVLASTLSGFYPAWKASQLTPIEALRHD